jgi:hypothetical protein
MACKDSKSPVVMQTNILPCLKILQSLIKPDQPVSKKNKVHEILFSLHYDVYRESFLPFSLESLISLLLTKKLKRLNYTEQRFYLLCYGSDSCSPLLREEHKLKMFEKMVLGRIFVFNRGEIKGGCRIFYNDKVHN